MKKIAVDPELWEALKSKALQSGQSVCQAAEEILRRRA